MIRKLTLPLVILMLFSPAFASHANMVVLPEKDRSPAPSFTTSDLDKAEVALEDYRGKVVLLHFWATWCGPCKEEMPHIEALWQKYRDKGLLVVGVSVQEKPNGQIRAFVDELGLSFPMLLDQEGSISEMYELSAMPTTYMISRDGKIISRVKGTEDWADPELDRLIKDLLI